jgi:uridine kinase
MIKNKRYAPNIAASLELNPEEIAFILDAKSETKEVQKIYEDAQLLINGETNHEIELYGKFREGETLAHVKEEKKEKDVIDKDKDTNTKDTNTKDTNIKDTNTKEKVQLSLADY